MGEGARLMRFALVTAGGSLLYISMANPLPRSNLGHRGNPAVL